MVWGMGWLELLLIHGIAWALIPQWIVDRFARTVRTWISSTLLAQAMLALALFAGFLTLGMPTLEVPFLCYPNAESPVVKVTSGWLYDGASGLMLCLVSFMGWVICRFSIRYLNGDPHQGNFYRWLAVASAGVSAMLISDSMATLGLAWLVVSLAVHRLLLHFPDRPNAHRAAWTKFVVSRIGDVSLLSAIILLQQHFGTVRFTNLFQLWNDPVLVKPIWLQAVPVLLAITAITKSVQFPFHTWMPLSLDTPTPVSAFMHAGIINAGGYLLIRTGPILNDSPIAMTLLVSIGALTALYGVVVMQTQASVKGALAYSTIAQMGFMILQCGLGAYSAAMLHILAHSCYKAYAFLSSGSVLQERARQRGALSDEGYSLGIVWFTSSVASILIVLATFAMMRIDVASKPGGILLAGLMTLALTSWLCRVVASKWLWLPTGMATGFAVCLLYSLAFLAVDYCLVDVHSKVPKGMATTSWQTWVFLVVAWIAFPVIQELARSPQRWRWLSTFRIHAANGFYIDGIFQRCFGKLGSL